MPRRDPDHSTRPDGPDRLRRQQVARDATGAFCACTGVLGLVIVAFSTDPLVGWAAVSALLLAVGLILGKGAP